MEQDKALKVWPISICVRGIEQGLKQTPVYSKLRVSSELLEGHDELLDPAHSSTSVPRLQQSDLKYV